MTRTLLKSKIHYVKCTETELNYEGSITIDADIMEKADIVEYEQVQVLNKSNGERIWTYAVEGNKGQFCLNGPAARKFAVDDEIIILSYVNTHFQPDPIIINHKDINNDTN